VLVAIIKKRLQLEARLYTILQILSVTTILQILSVTTFEKASILQILTDLQHTAELDGRYNQLNLFS